MYKKTLCLCLALLLPFTCLAQNSSKPINVFVSVLPMKYFVERVGGDKVAVSVMVTPGQSPETYAPTPKQLKKLRTAQIYYRIGVPFESVWLPNIVQLNSDLQIIDLRRDISLRKLANGSDPHVWTDPILVMQMAKTIRDSLSKIDPKDREFYAKNCTAFIAQLTESDRYIKRKLTSVTKQQRAFLVFHPAWGYFAARYGLEQIAIKKDGKEPGPKDLAAIITNAKSRHLKAVVVQPQFSEKQAEMIAHTIDGKLIVLDPLAEDYLTNMHKVADRFAEVLVQ
ncbi:MAG: zinc ABC transporter substrate-binding protein [Gammaproteobacteria bacterium]|nr:zinc ABC transporter substrate-binding protein [Gammaproteobacteria bacterium]